MFKARAILLGVLAAVIASAIAAASASAAPHFFLCEKLGAGHVFADSLCTKSTGGEYELVELTPSHLLTILSVGGPFLLKGKAVGVELEIKCANEHSTGWIENPAGGTAGIDLATNEFSSCEFKSSSSLAKGCEVVQPIKATDSTELSELGGAVWDIFKPDTEVSTHFAEIEFEKCSFTSLNKKFAVEGETAGLANKSTAKLEFGKGAEGEAMDKLKFAGNKATLEGESLVLGDNSSGPIVGAK
jgi:hypothetical protein